MLRKRIFTIILSFLIITLIGGGYSAFLLHSDKASVSANGNYRWDNVRANYQFNDGYDYEALPQKKYNIYFMAQSDFDPKGSSTEEGVYDYYYESSVTDNKLDLRYGQFTGQLHYKVLRNVTEISMTDLHEVIGYPYTEVTDRANKPNTSHGWPLYFNGWSLNYNIGNYDGLFTSSGYLRATGNFPHADKSISFMRFGISIQKYLSQLEKDSPDLYNEFAIYSRSSNVDDIFLFPVYTSGKDYVTSSLSDRNDPIQIRYNSEETMNDSNYKEVYLNEGKALNDSYDKYASSNTSLKDVKVYSKNAFSIDGFKNMMLKYDSCAAGWNGWIDLKPIDGCPANLLEIDSNSNKNHPFGNGLSIDDVGKGVYTIYAFKKEGTTNNSFSGSEIKFFNDFLKQQQVTIFYSFATEPITKNNRYNSFYIVFEKFYEPRLIGGPTGSWDYENESVKNYTFRRAVTNSNMFALENIDFTNNDATAWHSENGMQFSNLLFNVSLNNPAQFFSDKQYGEDSAEIVFKDVGLVNYEMYNYAHYFQSIKTAINETDFDLNEYIKRLDGSQANDYSEILNSYPSDSHIYKSLANAFVINPVKDDVAIDSPEKNCGYGVYSLALNIKYGNDYYSDLESTSINTSFGPYYPSSIDIYAYRETNIFTVIYDSQSDYNLDLMTGVNSRFIKPNLDGSNINYAFIAKSVFLDTPIGLSDVFLATDKAPTEFTSGNNYSLEEILEHYNKNDKKVIDSVTEFVFNQENLNNPGFRIKKNYVLLATNL